MIKKLLLPLSLVFALFTITAHAWTGGPWDNGSAEPKGVGYYQAIITGKNLLGMARYSDVPNSSFSAVDFSETTTADGAVAPVLNPNGIVFYRGVMFAGSAFITGDMSTKKVYGMVTASTDVNNESTLDGVSTPALTIDDDGFLVLSLIESGSSTSHGPVRHCNVSFTAKVIDSGKNQPFRGKGEAYFYGDLDVVARTTTETNGTTTTTTTSTGGNDEFTDVTNKISVKVFGSVVAINP